MEPEELTSHRPTWRRVLAMCLVVAVSSVGTTVHAKKKRRRDTKPPRIVHVKLMQTPRSQAVQIRARFEDKSGVFAPTLYYRQHGAAEFTTVEMEKGEEGWVALIPASEVTGPLEYFLEAFDQEGNGPAREGTPENPIPIAVYDEKAPPPPPPVEDLTPPPAPPPPPPPPPNLVTTEDPWEEEDDDGLAGQWWFWTGIGLAVTGGIVATVLLTRSSSPVDFVEVEVTGPDPTARLP
ncbi:MAG: hypothetical protein RMA76_37975 [Deltaproteobacteria bacterium]|jgi:hypothetical protein